MFSTERARVSQMDMDENEIFELLQKVREKLDNIDKKMTSMEVKMGIRHWGAHPTSGKVGDSNPSGERGNSGEETLNPGNAVDAEATVGAAPLGVTHAGMTWDVTSKSPVSTHVGTTSAVIFTPSVTPWSKVGLANPTPEAICPSIVGINQKRAPTPDILDEHLRGQDVRNQQVIVGQAVANIVKSSLDPVDFDEKLVDDIGDETIKDDGADGGTALKIPEVEHAIVKVLGELAECQDKEVSKHAEEKFIVKADKVGKEFFINCAKISSSFKFTAGDHDFFANFIEDGVQVVKLTNACDEVKYLSDDNEILEVRWESVKDSCLLNGYALNTGHAAQRMSIIVAPAKIVCLDFPLQKTKIHMSVQIVVIDPRELEETRKMEMTEERIKKLLKAWANVFLSTKGIDDMALEYLVEANAISVIRVQKKDRCHVAEATGAIMVSPIAELEGTANTGSLIFRDVDDYKLDEMEIVHPDASLVFEWTLESNTVVAGGSAVELALSVYLGYSVTPNLIRTPLYKEIKEQLFDVSKELLGGLPFMKSEDYQYIRSLLYEDYYARVEGREIISNLNKAAGIATIFAATCLDNGNIGEYVRNFMAKVFGVVDSAIGILELLSILETVCQSKKLWQNLGLAVKTHWKVGLLETLEGYVANVEWWSDVSGALLPSPKMLWVPGIERKFVGRDTKSASAYSFYSKTSDYANLMFNVFGIVVNSIGQRVKFYLPYICGTNKWWLNIKSLNARPQAEDLNSIIVFIMKHCQEEQEIVMTRLLLFLRGLFFQLTLMLRKRHEKVREGYIDPVGHIVDRKAKHVPAREWIWVYCGLLVMLQGNIKGVYLVTAGIFDYIIKAIGRRHVPEIPLNTGPELQNRVCKLVTIELAVETKPPIKHIGERGKNRIYKMTFMLSHVYMDRDMAPRQTTASAIKHRTLGVAWFGVEGVLIFLFFCVWPTILETFPPVDYAVMEAKKEKRVAMKLNYYLQRLFHPATKYLFPNVTLEDKGDFVGEVLMHELRATGDDIGETGQEATGPI